MVKYRIEHRYPCYNGGCIPYDGYFVQKLEEGFFTDKWIDIKGFGDRKRAEELLKILKNKSDMINRGRSFFDMIGFNRFCLFAIIVVLIGISTYVQYTKEETVIATIQSITTQQNVNNTNGNVSTSYTYLVGTDKGTMQIQPDGIMSSTAFGQLKEGKTYRLHTRGFSFPLFGMYPYIVDAKEE